MSLTDVWLLNKDRDKNRVTGDFTRYEQSHRGLHKVRTESRGLHKVGPESQGTPQNRTRVTGDSTR